MISKLLKSDDNLNTARDLIAGSDDFADLVMDLSSFTLNKDFETQLANNGLLTVPVFRRLDPT